MKLTLEHEGVVDFRTAADLPETLRLVDGRSNTFAILELENGHYIQTAYRDDGYVIEKQLGSLAEHFSAFDQEWASPAEPKRPFWQRLLGGAGRATEEQHTFALEDVVACFSAFMGEGEEPAQIAWRAMKL